MHEIVIYTLSLAVVFFIMALILWGLTSKEPVFMAIAGIVLLVFSLYGIKGIVHPFLTEHLSEKKGATIQQAVKWIKEGKKVVMLDTATRDPWNLEEDELILEEAAKSEWGIYTGTAPNYHQFFHSVNDKDIKTKD